MDDSLLMRMLNRLANLNEKFQPLAGRQGMLIAVFGDLDATNEFHDEIGPARFRRPGIEHLGDVGMIHQRERLSFGLKAGNDSSWCPCPA